MARKNISYGNIYEPMQKTGIFMEPVRSSRAPTARDTAEIGTIWVDKTLDDAYIITNVTAAGGNWVGLGGGAGEFHEIVVNPGNITLTAGALTMTALGAGVAQTDAAGIVTSNKGNNGEILISSTAGVPGWSAITAGAGIVVTNGANSIQIDATGAIASTFPTDGAIVTPQAGATTLAGGTNITTSGAVAGVVVFDLDDSINLLGAVTAGVDLSMTTGVCTISSDANAANAIYLHTNGGVNENITLNATQGTGVDSIEVQSVVGGISILAGLASAQAIIVDASNIAGGIDIDAGTNGISVTATNGPIEFISGTGAITVGTDAAEKDVTVGSTNAASKLTLQSGTGDLVLTSTDACTLDTVGVLKLNSSGGIISIGNDARDQNINIGTAGARVISIGNSTGVTAVDIDGGTGDITLGYNAVAHDVYVGNVTGTTSCIINSGTGGVEINSTGAGDISIDSDDELILDADGVIKINSSAGIIHIGNDLDAFGIQIGVGEAARPIVIGNVTGATSCVINSGTGGIELNSTGDGDITIDSDDELILVSDGVLTLNSAEAAISIGNGAHAFGINIGTGAAQRDIIIGNVTGTTSFTVNAGTGTCAFASNATDHTTNIGSVTGVSATTVSSGTGGLTLAAAGIVDMVPATDTQAAAAVTINANAGVGTFTGLTTAAAASQQFTITNSVCTVNSAILVTVANKGANDSNMTLERVRPFAGSFTLDVKNNGSQGLNGDCIITFWIIAA